MTSKSRTKKVTLRDVAREAGVSVATVSYVLNDTGSVGPAVRRKVRTVAQALGYRPNHSAKAMRTGRTQTIGLILPDLRNPFFAELAQSVQNAARRAGYAVFLFDSQDAAQAERDGAEELVRYGVDGIVWCPATDQDSLADHRHDVPIVVVARPIPGYDAVSSDYAAGGEILARYLIARGYRSAGMISGPQTLSSARLRRDGLVRGLAGDIPVVWEVENPFSVHLTDAAVDRLAGTDVSVIVCGNDLIAIGAIRALQMAGRCVPDDVAVVGYDDIPWAGVIMPGLTTVHQHMSRLGETTVDLLTRRIRDPEAPVEQARLEVALVARGSSAIGTGPPGRLAAG